MKTYKDEALAEVRDARKSLCDRFGNDPRRLLAYLRAQQSGYKGQIIKNLSEMESKMVLRDIAPKTRKS